MWNAEPTSEMNPSSPASDPTPQSADGRQRRDSQDRWLHWLISVDRRTLLLLALIVYAGLVLLFGFAYWALGDLNEHGLGSALYFSLITQATVGYGDVLARTGIARVLVSAQVLLGVAFVGLIPAVLVLRMLSPAQRAISFSRFGVFDPKAGQFRFRFVNDSALTASVRAAVRLPVRVHHLKSSRVEFVKHFRVRLEYDDLPPAKTHVCILVRTVPCEVEPGPLDSEHHDVFLHPAHVGARRSIRVRLEISYPLGGVRVIEQEFGHADIRCGELADVTGVDRTKDWSKFDRVMHEPAVDDTGISPCESSCVYRDGCKLVNKYSGRGWPQ